MRDEIILTVFTPTYNRADLLARCFESMLRQTDKRFMWMIIDDGSEDNTRELAEGWKSKASEYGFDILYIYKSNGGLHTAYNTAIENAETELLMCVDSDDYLPDDAVERIIHFWTAYGSDEYAGIVGLDFDLSGQLIGDPLPDQKSVNLIDLLVGKYKLVNGDRKNVVRTILYKEVAPMKSFPGEKNFNPHYMHLKISEKYDFLVMNENLCFVEYQSGGMTNSIIKQYKNSPQSFMEIRKLYLGFKDTPLSFRVRHSIHYVSSCILAGRKKEILFSPRPILGIACIPAGWLLSCFINKKGS